MACHTTKVYEASTGTMEHSDNGGYSGEANCTYKIISSDPNPGQIVIDYISFFVPTVGGECGNEYVKVKKKHMRQLFKLTGR